MAGLAPLAARKSKSTVEAKRPAPAKPKPRQTSAISRALQPPPLSAGKGRAALPAGERLQAKLMVSEPDDQLEREADRVAEHVMRMPAGGSAGAPPSGNAGDDEKNVQRAALNESDEDKPAQRMALEPRADDEALQRAATEDDCPQCEGALQRACASCDDELAQRAVELPEEELQRACGTCDDEEHLMRQGDFFTKPPPELPDEELEPEAVQRKGRRGRKRRALPAAFQARVGEVRRGGGEPLPAPLRHFMEARFSDNFERVRIHRDAAAADVTSSVNARAFTIGRHLFFNQGEFQPHTQRGQRLVAHELTHVLQQRGGMHSVQREVLEREPAPEAVKQADQRQRAAEKLDFATIAELFGWREDVLPPLVFDTLRELVSRALNVVASRESLAVFALDEPLEEDVRRIVHSPQHELELELEQRGDEAPPDTRWTLDFLDGSRVPAKGGAPVTIHTDEDSISVNEPDRTRTVPPEAAPAASQPATSTTSTAVSNPVGSGTAAPDAASSAPAPEPTAPDAAGAEKAAPAEEAAFPAAPEEDPNFRAVAASADNAADAASAHQPGAELAENAKDAAAVTPGEQLSKAQGTKTDEMQAAKTPGFDKAAFVQAVLDKVRATAPHSLPEAASFGQNKQALTDTINQAAGAQTDRTASELKTVTDAAPNAAAVAPRPPVELTPEALGARPADIKAERAVPPERPHSQVEGAIEANQAEAKAKLDSLGFPNPEAALANANDPQFAAGIEAKNAFDADAAAAPAAFREGEQQLRSEAMSEAGALGKQELGAMVAVRTSVVGQVATGQRGGKASSEQKRANVITRVNGIFNDTATKVKTTLGNLRTQVNATFQVESKKALDTFTSRVVNAERRWNEKSFLDQAAEKVGSIFGIPTELDADLQAIRNAFIEEMKRIVEDIAATVERELATAKQQIADGRAELKTFLDSLDPSLGTLRDTLRAEFDGKFGSLESEVKNTEQSLVTGLAEMFKARLGESDKLLTNVRDRNRSVLDDLGDVVSGIKDAVLGMVAKLQEVFADGVATLMEVLANPVTFAKNFLAGISQGFQNFAANIGTHLKTGLIEWLTGSLAGAGITLPQTFDLKGIVSLILQLLGLTIDNVKARARIIWGEKIVRAIELGVEGVKKAAELFTILENEGVGGLFNFLKEKFVEFKDIALQKIKEAVTLELVEAAVKKVATLLVPGGAILQAVLSIIDAVFFFIRNADKIAALVQTITGAVKDILAGNVSALAAKVEAVLASTIPIVLDFLASLIGIGGKITGAIQKALKAVTQPIQDAIDAVLLAIKNAVGGLIDKLIGRGGKDPAKAEEVAPGTPMTEQQIIDAVVPLLGEPTVESDPALALEEKQKQAQELKKKFQPSAPEGKTLHIVFKDKSPHDVADDAEIDMEVGFSPGAPVVSKLPGNCGPGEGGAPSRSGVEVILTPQRLDAGGGSGASGKAIGQYPAYNSKDDLNRSHVLGAQLGGEGRHPNLVLTSRELNSPEMRDVENEVAKGVRAGRRVRYKVSFQYGGPPVVVDRDQAVTIARGAEFSNPSAIDFNGVKSFKDVIPLSVTMSATLIATCPHDKLAEGDALLADFKVPLTEKPLVVARRRAAVANAFSSVLRD